MSVAPSREARDAQDGTERRRPIEAPAGLRLLVPGWPQLAWGQSGRGWVLLGSFVTAIAAAALAWGTWLGWVLIAFAYLAHVTSASDAIRQASFPVDHRRTAVPVIAAMLGLLFYLPTLVTLLDTAWPGRASPGARGKFLVNCWTYRGASPQRGDWVWLRLPPRGTLALARVVAVSGQVLEWTGQDWRLDSQPTVPIDPRRHPDWPRGCLLNIPDGQVLVEPQDDGTAPSATGSLVLVPKDQVIGRAWAQYYPVWERRLL